MTSSSSGVATIRELAQPYINVAFALSGKQLPADQGVEHFFEAKKR